MCPPVSVPPTADISFDLSDEGLFISLDKFERGFPFPDNVFADINPYQYMPSELSEGIWYFVCSEKKRDPKVGFWKAIGETCAIFTNSVITGWRTTLEFYEGQAPHGRRTDWVMQEYKITKRGPCHSTKQKDSRYLCRVFRAGGQSPNPELNSKKGAVAIEYEKHSDAISSTCLKANPSAGESSSTEREVKNRDQETGSLPVAERHPEDPAERLTELEYILSGDYLELDDLADPESPSSSSHASSCLSFR